MRNFSSLFGKALFIFLIHSVSSYSQNSSVLSLPPSPLKIRLVFEAEISDSSKELLATLALQSLKKAEEILKIPLKQSVELHFDTRKSAHNGYTTLIPRNRILIFLSPPETDSSLSAGRDYVYETLLHEWAHLLSSSERSKIFSALHPWVGNLSSPNGLWPRWIHEGLAVWVESQDFGRGQSGAVHLDLRRFSEFTPRSPSDALLSSDLDGHSSLKEFSDPGDLPYHFGYLFWRDWLKKYPHNEIKDFVIRSSASLGLSFRQTFRELGSNIDSDFEEFKSHWKQEPTFQPQSPPKKVSESRKIKGPFQNSSGNVTWIEYARDKNPQIKIRKAHERDAHSLEWPKRWGKITSIQFLAHPELLIVLSHQEEEYESTLRFFENKILKCEIPIEFSTEILSKEIRKIFLITQDKSGVSEIHEKELDLDRCAILSSKSIFQGQAFDRISYLRFEKERTQPFFTLAKNRNSLCEENLSTDFTPPTTIKGFSNLQKIQCKDPGQSCYLAQYYSKDYLGPVLIHENSLRHLTYQKLPLRTGSHRFALLNDSEILVKESLWEKDEMNVYSLDDFKKAEPFSLPQGLCSATAKEANKKTLSSVKEEPYSPLTTLSPKFWIPMASFYDSGMFLGAYTFYSDIRNEYSGQTSLGYLSDVNRLFFDSNLKTPALFASSLFDSSLFEVGFYPAQIYSTFQNRGYESLGLVLQTNTETLLSYSALSFVQHRWGTKTTSYSSFHRAIPGILHSLGTYHSTRSFKEPIRISKLQTGAALVSKIQWIRSLELAHRLNLQTRFGTRVGGFLNIDHAYSDPKNFPLSFFEWGGAYSLSTATTPYLNRGFQPRTALARSLIRAHLSSAFNVWNPQWAMSWNRFRIESIDLRILAESLSFDSTYSKSSYRVGNKFFSTVGAETQIFGQTLGYVGYHLSLGVFKGFGPSSETRMQLGLGGQLDL